MRRENLNYRLIIIIMVLIMCSVIGAIYYLTINKIDMVYKEAGTDGLLDLKKVYLKDTVDNLVLRIEELRKETRSDYNKIIDHTLSYIEQIEDEADFKEWMRIYFNAESTVHIMDAMIIDLTSGSMIYANKSDLIYPLDLEANQMRMQSEYERYEIVTFDLYRVFIGVKRRSLDAIVINKIKDELHQSSYADDSYIWVNEILNYSGGDNYAIRLIHPNLIDTEGALLSTNTTDIKGNHPYLIELEGVKREGAIFYSYYFKKLSSDVISEKLTYSKLYPDFNWIISMGVHLDDISDYLTITSQKSKEHINALIRLIIVLILILSAVSIGFLIALDRWYNSRIKRKLIAEAMIDPLTGAFNRRAGVRDLTELMRQYLSGDLKQKVAIVMMDLDDFKLINDTYGHETGDKVLGCFTRTIKDQVRQSDRLYRWGGEEFLLVLEGLGPENFEGYDFKLLSALKLRQPFEDLGNLVVTMSMGIAFFEQGDIDYKDVLERADRALYLSKKTGKDRANICLKNSI